MNPRLANIHLAAVFIINVYMANFAGVNYNINIYKKVH